MTTLHRLFAAILVAIVLFGAIGYMTASPTAALDIQCVLKAPPSP